METKKYVRQGTKPRLWYQRQRTLSDGDTNLILGKDPSEMTEHEKIVWKVEIFKQCEDTDDYVYKKLETAEQKKNELKNLIRDTKNVIQTYNDAVDRIGRKAEENRPKPVIN